MGEEGGVILIFPRLNKKQHNYIYRMEFVNIYSSWKVNVKASSLSCFYLLTSLTCMKAILMTLF